MKKLHLFSLLIAVTMMAMSPLGLRAQTQPSTGTGKGSDPYMIGTADELLWFANQVNTKDFDICAKLTADITFTSSTYANTMIGKTKYNGTFDGNGHTITVSFTRTANDAALFENLYYGMVKNLTVAGTITTSAKYAAGICAHSYCGSVTGCTSLVEIESTVKGDGYHGGICAEVESKITIKDCLFAGKMNGSNTTNCGGLVGSAGGTTTISNCLVTATFDVSTTGCNTISRNPDNATITNCYYLNSLGDVPSGATQVTDAQLKSGEIAYKLQNDRADLIWGQDLSTSGTYPVPGGTKVNLSPLDCTGTPCADATYTNATPTQNSHTLGEEHAAVAATCTTAGNVAYKVCTVCGKYFDTEGNEITDYTIPALGHNSFDGVCSRCGSAATEVEVGNKTYYDNNSIPYHTNNKYSTTLTFYKGSNIEGSGLITSIAYDVYNAMELATNEVKVYMMMTDGEGISHTPSDYTLVYSGNPTLGTSTGWETLTLNTPFYFDHSKNLLIAVCRKSDDCTSMLKYYMSACNVATQIYYNDSNEASGDLNIITKGDPPSSTSASADVRLTFLTAPSGDGSLANPYQISNANELLWFANKVNNGKYAINAQLTADIDFASYTNTMIGTTQYSGTFDGNGHTITVSFDRSDNDAALFENLYGTVKNLTVAGTITTSKMYAAGICAHSYGGTVKECTSLVDIESTVSGEGAHGGICAVAETGGITIDDCLFAGQMNGSNTTNCGGLVGWAGNSTVISNSLVIATFGVSTTGSNTIARNPDNATITYCYYKNSLGDVPLDVTQVTDDQLASGYVAYTLQNGRTDLVWGQNITTDPKDTYPVLGGTRVYATRLNCADQPTSCSNSETTPIQKDGHICDDAQTYKECTVCGKYFDTEGNEITDYTLVPYKISTAAELLWFANQVNGGDYAINAKLIADIDFTSSTYANTMIGTTKYSGTFDGNGHTITVSYNRTEDDAALFENLYGTVKNLTVAGTITTSAHNAAGICANSYGGKVTGCTSLVDIESTASVGCHGGICAVAKTGGLTLEDCLFAGKMNGSNTTNCSGLLGWAGNTPTIISNSLVIATFGINTTSCNTIARNPSNATITNCYYLNSLGDVPSGATQVTADQLASGYVAYMLQNDRADLVWGQDLSTESHPVLGGTRVYATNLYCTGLPRLLTNSVSTPILDAHTFDADHTHAAVASTGTTAGNIAYKECTVCGKYFDMADNEITETDYTLPYEISTAADLLWFANQVNGGNSAINANLAADIDFTSNANTMIGTSYRYSGTFDGKGHKITVSFDRTDPYTALFQNLSGTVTNLTVAGTITTSSYCAAGICANSYGGSVTRCTSLVDIEGSYNQQCSYGGICAYVQEGGITIEDCLFAGQIIASDERAQRIGGLVGYVAYKPTKISNSLVTATLSITITNTSHTIAPNPTNESNHAYVTVTNCYYKNYLYLASSGSTRVTDDQLASGEVAYKLQNGRKETVWGQNLSTDPKDSQPVLGGARVNISHLYCSGELYDDATYTNEATNQDAHTFAADDVKMGVCTTCNHSFFRYTADDVVTPYAPNNLLGPDNNKLTIKSNTCTNGNGVIEFDKPLVTIGIYAFYNCNGFTGNLTIPNSVTTIGNLAFSGCTGLTNIQLNSIPTFGSDAFSGCTSNSTLALTDDSYVYTSGKDNFPTLASATYTRTVSASENWGTIVLPFAIKSNDSYQLYTLSSVTTDDNGMMTFTPTDDVVAAGTPCVFKKKDASATEITFTATSTAVDATTTLTATPITNWTLNGTYTKLTDQTGMYFIAQDKFWKADTGIAIKPFRAWFTTTSGGGVKMMNIMIDDNDAETAILAVDADGRVQDSGIYSVNGQRLSAPQKGHVNIINGKKVFVK